MNNIFQKVIEIFSNVSIDESEITEGYIEAKIKVNCNNGKIPSVSEYNTALNSLNPRDNIHFSILENNEVVDNFNSNSDVDFSDYINNCSSCLDNGNFEVILTIEKNNINQNISIYYPDSFIRYLDSLSIGAFLFVINSSLNKKEKINFEIQSNSPIEFNTNSIRIASSESCQCFEPFLLRETRNNQIKNLCYCNILSQYEFVPEDFYPIKKSQNDILNEVFCRVSILYSVMFLFDLTVIKDEYLEYKLTGYKSLNEIIKVSEVDIKSVEVYYQIYKWVYEGGNIVDKIGLVRNIISLNFEPKSFNLSETTFFAIQSSFKIYQKENINQYIEIRNKTSDQLMELKNMADKIVAEFIGDYKKSIFTLVSFFISVIVIRVVSKGDFIGGFSFEVSMLAIGFLLISLAFMFLAKWEINKQIIRCKEFYENLKDRYTDLLHPSDINRILNNDKDFNSNISFIKNKRNSYTILWIISIIILFIVVVLLYAVNVFHNISFIFVNILLFIYHVI